MVGEPSSVRFCYQKLGRNDVLLSFRGLDCAALAAAKAAAK